jgi:hypothetical protein
VKRLLFLVLLAGCAPATTGALREEASGSKVFEVEQNYQAVYRAVVGQARRCHLELTRFSGRLSA